MKSSLDYVELFGLRVALQQAQTTNTSKEILLWLAERIKTLENK